VAANQVTAARAEESGGLLDNLLVRPVSRLRWLGGRLALAFGVLLLSGVAAGLFAWIGAATQHTGSSFGDLLAAGVNLVPPAIVILGIGILTYGAWPRATSFVVYTVLSWSLLVVIVGGFGTVSHWVLDTSVFHHMASAPGVPPNWEANGIMVAVGVLAALVGALTFRRRDLQGA
jgi:ABC-2 type transport system permease protein